MRISKIIGSLLLTVTTLSTFTQCTSDAKKPGDKTQASATDTAKVEDEDLRAPVDTAKYNEIINKLANGDTTGKWPVKNDVVPIDGAILPYNRIVAYYGNLYSKKMGALGEYPPKEMWSMLLKEVDKWNKADTLIKSIPAVHYIATVASGTPGKDGLYINRMPDKQIDSALTIAKMHNSIVFLDVQVALSNLRAELPRLEKYLKMPHVHLGIDPEFAMAPSGKIPGKKIGTYDAADINYATEYLAKLVKENNLPAKILVVHRFTQGMVTNYKNIKLRKETQIVMDMDGWGEPELKKGTYRNHLYKEPVQFVGFKLFYKNDLKRAPNVMMTPSDLMKLTPKPIYIQYQ